MLLGRSLRAGAAVLLSAAALPAGAHAQDAYVDWPALLPPIGAPFTPNLEPDCADGDPACIDRTIVEMQRRFHAVVPRCDHRSVFALAYLRVTEDVRAADRAGVFADSRWLQQEDAVFARMYFEAYDRYEAGKLGDVPRAWQLAFDAARDRELSALGDFLMSMNAHINRDFPYLLAGIGITKPDGTSRKPDHDVYNRRLAALYVPVLTEVAARFDPTADDLDAGPVDDAAAAALLQSWRELVWRNAERLVLARGARQRQAVARDIESYATNVARTIRSTFRGDGAARAAWCATNGGQDPALAPARAQAPAPARGEARVLVPRGGLRIDRAGVVRVRLRCPAATAGCLGTLRLGHRDGRGRTLASVRYALPAGAGRTVAVRGGPAARRAGALRLVVVRTLRGGRSSRTTLAVRPRR